jgi:phospholipase C
MLENHSFDQMLGCFKQLYPELEGVDPATPNENGDSGGRVYQQAATTERIMFLDPHHEVPHVAVQLSNSNSGFVKDFGNVHPK